MNSILGLMVVTAVMDMDMVFQENSGGRVCQRQATDDDYNDDG